MEKYKVQSMDAITPELISSLIQRYKLKELPRLKRLNNYYLGQSDIKNRPMKDPSKPNEKIANNFCGYITDTVNGYFMGKPVSYSSDDEDFMSKLQLIFDQNHEQTHNSLMAKNLSILGIAYELVYMNETNEIKMAVLDPKETFLIYDNTIEQNVFAGVRFIELEDYASGETVTNVEVYTSNMIQYYEMGKKGLMLVDEKPHYFNDIPINVYENNFDGVGDWEKVIDLINAYDLVISDTLNNLQYFSDCYLVLTNFDLSEDDIALMKERKVISLSENGSAEWLTKSTLNMEIEAFKTRLKEDIHSFSQVPDINDKNFNQSISGEALKYKLFSLENAVAIKERMFEKGLERRVKLITTILNIKGGNFVYTDIVMAFSRNLPINLQMLADMITKLSGIVSNETLLTLLPFIDDVQYEQSIIQKEKDSTVFGTFGATDVITSETTV